MVHIPSHLTSNIKASKSRRFNFFFDDQKKSIKIDTTDFWAPNWRIWACFEFSQEGFKKSQLARKLKTSSRKNFLEACTTSTWLTNKPYDNLPNRTDQFFWCDWKKSLIFWNFQKSEKKHSFQHLLTSFRFSQIFKMAFKKILPVGNFFYDNG